MVTFPTTENHWLQIYATWQMVTRVHKCEQLAHGRYVTVEWAQVKPVTSRLQINIWTITTRHAWWHTLRCTSFKSQNQPRLHVLSQATWAHRAVLISISCNPQQDRNKTAATELMHLYY